MKELAVLYGKLENDALQFVLPDVITHHRIYIPGIRTLRPFAKRADVELETRKEYEFSTDVIINNGQNLANEIQMLRNAPYPENRRLEKFEQFLSDEFFESRKIRLNVPIGSQLMTIKIGDEKEQPIYNLGDGLQMVIILTFPFFAYDKGFAVIEEPELFIHPGLQKTLVQFLCNHPLTKSFQIFMATHSNHIVDSINNSNKISLFTVQKTLKSVNKKEDEKLPDFMLENVAYGDQNLLRLLGIANSSVYLSNSTIWVEGITDKMYIQKFIAEYLKQPMLKDKYNQCQDYQEGVNYSFALTGGDSIIHWDFEDDAEYEEHKSNIIVRKFCGKSLLIVDNDFGKNSKRKKYLKDLLQERFIELKVPEIENLLQPIVIKQTLLEYSSVESEMTFDSFPDIDIDVMRKYKIGHIIDNILLKRRPNVKKFSKKSGVDERSSLKSTDKFTFCEKALLHIQFGSMSKDSIKLVEQILDFVISQNPARVQ